MDEIFTALERGAIHLTATRRLARATRSDFTAWQRDQGRSVWKSPRILPLDAYVRALFADWLGAGDQAWTGMLLTARQESLVWQQIIGDSPEGASLLQIDATARRAMDAWRLIHESRLPLDGRYSATEDCEAFLGWARTFERRCARESWLDTARLPDFVLDRIRRGDIESPHELSYAGFDEMSPLQREFLAAIGAKPYEPPFQRTVTRTRVCPTAADELRCAAVWSRELLELNPSARIGIIVPALSRLRSKAERIFREELQPGAAPDADPPFHISLGRPLSDYPMIRAAFLAIEFAAGPLPLTKVGMLLRSPYIGGAADEIDERALLDARLRRAGRWELSSDDVRKLSAGDCPRLARALKKAVIAAPSKALSRQDCLRHVTGSLSALQWPGDRELNSHEFQLRQAWTELLSEFASLDAIAGPITIAEAIEQLRAVANAVVFQFEDTGAPIQISDHNDAAGLRFDHLWIVGLDDETLPAPADPNPFLPLPLQWERRVPHSSAALQAGFARMVFDRLTSSAPEVILSYAQSEGDRSLAPSPLLTAPPQPVAPKPEAWIVSVRAAAQFETIVDETGPPHTGDAIQRGGARLLGDMAACPFRAFAAYRLDARELENLDAGLSARDRGGVTHAALQGIWGELQSHAALCALASADLADLVRRHVDASLARFDVNTNTRVEAIRLERLLLRWLDLERRREPFSIVKLEEKRPVEVGGLHFDIRADRIDEIPDGRQLILDYKTGELKPKAWLGPRLDEPQLPLYAITGDAEIAAAVFAHVRADGVEFAGVAETPLPDFKSFVEKNPPPLAAQIRKWRKSLTTIAGQFRSGDARVDPKNGGKTCEYCPMVALCRIKESIGVAEPEDE